MRFKHENLEVWKLSLELINNIYLITSKFPKNEEFSLTSQIKRSSTSIALNIAEGSERYSKKDFAKHIRIAIGSLLETDAALKIAIKLNYLDNSDYSSISELIKELYFKLIKLDKPLVNRNDN